MPRASDEAVKGCNSLGRRQVSDEPARELLPPLLGLENRGPSIPGVPLRSTPGYMPEPLRGL